MINIQNKKLLGTAFCLLGELIITPDSVLLRSVSLIPDYTIMFYRFLLYGLVSLIIFMIANGKQSFSRMAVISKWEIAAGLVWAIQNFLFTAAILRTSAANVLVCFALSPLFSAILSYFVLGETIPRRTIIASIVAFGSISFIMCTELTSDINISTLIGDVLALIMSILTAVFFVFITYIEKFHSIKPDVNFCNMVAGFVVMLLALALGGTADLTVSSKDGGLLFLQGAVVLPLALALITLGSQYILPAEVSLYMLIEVPFGSLWVYVAGYEAPPRYTMYGGAILMAALAVNGYLDIKESRAASAAADINSSADHPAEVVSTQVPEEGTIELESAISPMADLSDLYKG